MKFTLAALLPALAVLAGCSDKNTGDTAAAVEDDTGTTDTLPTDGTDPVDEDGDGFTTDDDCDDSNPYINPDADEICDGVDNDCNDQIDDDALGAGTWFQDSDDDDYGNYDVPLIACDMPEGYTSDATDCDDTDPAYNPGALEDDCTDPNDYNCDGVVDFVDADGDGYAECVDCDDSPETGVGVGPGTVEICDGLDNDCDGEIDNDATDGTTWYLDEDRDGYGGEDDALIACDEPEGYISEGGDCDDGDRGVYPGALEYCNEGDDDCDSVIDEDAADLSVWYADDDNDTFGDDDDTLESCSAPAGYAEVGGDCADSDVNIYPGADEACDEVDEDCDDIIDEDPTDGVFLYADADEDGYGDPDALLNACDGADGYTEDDQDCDDTNAAVNPDGTEVCGDGLDNDCDGGVDNDATDAATLYPDEDGDGYGVDGDTLESCELLDGYSASNTDCDDEDEDINPGAVEVCDEVDQDCDETVDEDALDASDWYIDADEDGYGGDDTLVSSCDEPEGYTDRGGDCDDADEDYNPGALEDDCTDPNDYNCDGSVGYDDADGDGYAACEECDDSQEYVYPGATELCDGQPNDCDTLDSWTDDDGIVTLFPSSGGTPVDYTASFSSGSGSSAPEVAISTSGELEVCDGVYYVRPRLTSSQLKITGSSPENVIINGGGGQGPILMGSDNLTIDISGLTVTGGDGCFGAINAMYTSTCAAGSIGWSSYLYITLNVTDVVITDNDSPYGYYYYGGGISMRSGFANMYDTAIYNNNMNGVFAHDTQVVCEGDDDIAAGTWDNTFYGMQAYDVFYGPSTFTSTKCDFDQGLPNGSGAQNHTYASSSCATYGDDETFYCDETGCDYCP